MLACFRMGSCLALLSWFIIGAAWLVPGTARDLGLDLWNLPEMLEDMQRDQAKLAGMNDSVEQIERSVQAKDQIVEEVIKHKLSLREAASRFRALYQTRISPITYLKCSYPQKTQEERLCRQVIHFTRCRLARLPNATLHLANQMEQQLNERLALGLTLDLGANW